MKKVTSPKSKQSLLKKDVRLKYTRERAKEYVGRLMKDRDMTQMQAMRQAIKDLRIDEMQELELRRSFD
jgi:ribosomal 50S subunit-associated protein YjgA (DUF615 family)